MSRVGFSRAQQDVMGWESGDLWSPMLSCLSTIFLLRTCKDNIKFLSGPCIYTYVYERKVTYSCQYNAGQSAGARAGTGINP